MVLAKITSKGQTTIPIEIRRALGLHAGDQIIFDIDSNGNVIMSKAAVTITAREGVNMRIKKVYTLDEIRRHLLLRNMVCDKYDCLGLTQVVERINAAILQFGVARRASCIKSGGEIRLWNRS